MYLNLLSYELSEHVGERFHFTLKGPSILCIEYVWILGHRIYTSATRTF